MLGRRMQRSIDRTIDRRPSRLTVHWSLIATTIVARFPTMALAIDILQSFVIERPRGMRPLLEIVANIADRSHLGPIVRSRNRTIRCDHGLRHHTMIFNFVGIFLSQITPLHSVLSISTMPLPLCFPRLCWLLQHLHL